MRITPPLNFFNLAHTFIQNVHNFSKAAPVTKIYVKKLSAGGGCLLPFSHLFF